MKEEIVKKLSCSSVHVGVWSGALNGEYYAGFISADSRVIIAKNTFTYWNINSEDTSLCEAIYTFVLALYCYFLGCRITFTLHVVISVTNGVTLGCWLTGHLCTVQSGSYFLVDVNRIAWAAWGSELNYTLTYRQDESGIKMPTPQLMDYCSCYSLMIHSCLSDIIGAHIQMLSVAIFLFICLHESYMDPSVYLFMNNFR